MVRGHTGIDAVLFDMDGLMFDTERVAYEMLRAVCSVRGLDFTLDMKRQMCGANFAVSAQIFKQAFATQDPHFSFAECWGEVRQKMHDQFSAHGVPCKAGLRTLLDFLRKQGIYAAVVSGSATAAVQKYVDMAGLTAYFSAIVGGTEIPAPKPAPDGFLLAAEWMGVDPAHCLVLEDSGRGLQAAYRAGMHAIWIPDLDIPNAEIIQRVDAVCQTLYEVIDWLEPSKSPHR
ncbi:MAG: HAD family phosphatase [Butyricicoccus sp.]|nr:HAD family phosphatase [Butyricicoccus sp.]